MSFRAPDRKRAPVPGLYRAVGGWLLVVSLVTAIAPAWGAGSVKQSERDLEKVKARIVQLNERIKRDRNQKDELARSLEAAELKASESQQRLKRIRDDIARQNDRILDCQAQQSEARYRLDEQRDSLGQQLKAAYAMGTRSRTRLWLSQEDAARTGRVLAFYDVLGRERARLIDGIRTEVEQIARMQKELIDERSRLEGLEYEQVVTLESLDKSRKQRQETLEKIDQRLASSEDELKQAKADEEALNKLLRSLRDALSDIPLDLDASAKPFAQLRRKLPAPLKGPILADFGTPKADSRLTWNGRWIGAKEGAPIKAIARGRVAYTGWLQRYGQILILEHDGGYFTLYGHCSAVLPSAGEWVEAGQVIGNAGDSGGHDKSGVYLEIRKGATALNPADWLAK